MKDAASLREHFAIFCEKYGGKHVFSQVYVKFLFSNLLKTFYESLPATDEKELNEEIELLYKSEDFDTVRGIVDKNIDRLAGSFDKNPSMVHPSASAIDIIICMPGLLVLPLLMALIVSSEISVISAS